MVTRECVKDDVIDGVRIPAGSKIFINIKTCHLNPKLWPEPMAYKPERFEEKFDIYNFNAFINGPRNCLGQHLATAHHESSHAKQASQYHSRSAGRWRHRPGWHRQNPRETVACVATETSWQNMQHSNNGSGNGADK